MTELERWMDDHPPLADALTAVETAALRQKVLARRPKLHALRGWRLVAAAAALCLVAAGAVVLGLFHPMSAANETNALVQKYGEVLDEPLTAEINGRTVSVKALLRGENTVLHADAALLGRAVENLLNNAARHNAPGVHITLAAVLRENALELTVADDGAGYPAAPFALLGGT